MNRKPGDSYRKVFRLYDPVTGLPADCSYGNPIGNLIRNGDRDGAASITTTRTELGMYKMSGTIPVGYASGDLVQVEMYIMLGTADHYIIVDEFLLDAKLTSDLQDVSAANVKTQAMSALTDQGYTVTRAGYLDRLDAAISTVAASVWNALTASFATAGSIGKKLTDWALGSDNRVLVSANYHTSGETIYNVSNDGLSNIRADLATLSTIATLQTNLQNYGNSHWATVSTGAVADAVLTELVADHEVTAGSLAAYLKSISTAAAAIQTKTDLNLDAKVSLVPQAVWEYGTRGLTDEIGFTLDEATLAKIDAMKATIDLNLDVKVSDVPANILDFVVGTHDDKASDTIGSLLRDLQMMAVGKKSQNTMTHVVAVYEKNGTDIRLTLTPEPTGEIRYVTPARS